MNSFVGMCAVILGFVSGIELRTGFIAPERLQGARSERGPVLVRTGSAEDEYVPSALERYVLVLVNRQRDLAHLGPLLFSPQLQRVARLHNLMMAASGVFAHQVPGESGLIERLDRFGVEQTYAGENIFESTETLNLPLMDECVHWWMLSEGHRRNILDPQFAATGVAVSHDGDATYVTETFTN